MICTLFCLGSHLDLTSSFGEFLVFFLWNNLEVALVIGSLSLVGFQFNSALATFVT